uniref:Uncharacterized protein n=1 Tax=Anguilla anguilla TaxID=7936 RepID=A0A0E9VZG1_ANGAN
MIPPKKNLPFYPQGRNSEPRNQVRAVNCVISCFDWSIK